MDSSLYLVVQNIVSCVGSMKFFIQEFSFPWSFTVEETIFVDERWHSQRVLFLTLYKRPEHFGILFHIWADNILHIRFVCIVRMEAKIRKRYNQVQHLTLDTTWESNKNTINITNNSKEVSTFPAGDHNAAMNRRNSMSRNTRHKQHWWSTKAVPPWNGQKQYFTGGLKPVSRPQPHP